MSPHTPPRTQVDSLQQQHDHQRGVDLYMRGRTTVFAHRRDPRFSWMLYVPPEDGQGPLDLVVSVHGTLRNAADYREYFVDFARWNRCIVLAPIFPVGVFGDDDRDGYKYILEQGLRYDHLLLEMIDDIATRYSLRSEKFGLFGFSGGGQFANRFMLLHPQRLWGVSVGAPGAVTLLDPERGWWVGVRDMEAVLGTLPDIEALRQLPIQLISGGADLETWGVTQFPGGSRWMEGANDAGATRPDKLAALQRSLAQLNITAELVSVPGVAHNAAGVVEPVKTFFACALSAWRKRREG